MVKDQMVFWWHRKIPDEEDPKQEDLYQQVCHGEVKQIVKMPENMVRVAGRQIQGRTGRDDFCVSIFADGCHYS